MAPPFMLLPPEIRKEIYRHLFDLEYGVQLTQWYSSGHKTEPELRMGVFRIEVPMSEDPDLVKNSLSGDLDLVDWERFLLACVLS